LDRTIVSIDVGTTKICTLVAEVSDNDALRVVGVGVANAKGLRRGVITDVEQAAKSIGESIQRAERVSGHTIAEAYVGVGGSHIASQNSHGVVAIGRGDRPIDRDDVERALEAAQAVAVPHNRRIIHCIPREFTIDGQDGIKNPIGLMGYRLEVEAHLITGAVTSIQNLVHCVEANHVAITDLVLLPLASAEAVLTEEERSMGVAVVDLGGGTTDVAIYVEGSIWETLVFPVGGNHITNDVAVGLRTPFATAEDAKVRYAHVLPSAVDGQEQIEISVFGDESVLTISRRELCKIVAMRVEEICEWIAREIKRSGFDGLLPAGIVFTGGSASLPGLRDFAARQLQLPVRIGMPRRLHGLIETVSSPAYAASVGLLLWGQREDAESVGLIPRPGIPGDWMQRLREWLKVFLPFG
jgi:cell division protein FtsA